MEPQNKTAESKQSQDVSVNEDELRTGDTQTPKQFAKERIKFGYTLMVLSFAMFFVIVVLSINFTEEIQPKSSPPHVFDCIVLSARAIITVASGLFAYKMLQAGERMVFPLTMVKNTEDLKIILGFNRSETLIGGSKNNEALNTLVEFIESRTGEKSK
jgi:hypothetical protein